MKVFVDTNIVIDLLINRKPFSEDAERIFSLCENGKIQCFVSASSITDIYYISKKYLKDKDKTKCVILDLLSIVDIIDVTKHDVLNALLSEFNDFEDALQYYCACKEKLDFIITRNLKDFKSSKIVALKPQDFLNKYF